MTASFESPKYESRPAPGQVLWGGGGGAWSYPFRKDLDVHFHVGFEVGIVLGGEEEILFEGFSMTCRPGDVWLCAAWEPHGWRVLDCGVRTVVPIFLAEFLGDSKVRSLPWQALFTAPPSQRPRALDLDTRRHFCSIGEDLSREMLNTRPSWEDLVRLQLLHLLTELCRVWVPPRTDGAKRTRNTAPGPLPTGLMPAIRLVEDAPERRISVEQAAAACAMSRSGFQLAFRRAAGVTFGRFCMHTRLAAAAHLLTRADLTIKAIAAKTGFWDDSHLHRCFLMEYGETPAQYRERQHSVANERETANAAEMPLAMADGE